MGRNCPKPKPKKAPPKASPSVAKASRDKDKKTQICWNFQGGRCKDDTALASMVTNVSSHMTANHLPVAADRQVHDPAAAHHIPCQIDHRVQDEHRRGTAIEVAVSHGADTPTDLGHGVRYCLMGGYVLPVTTNLRLNVGDFVNIFALVEYLVVSHILRPPSS